MSDLEYVEVTGLVHPSAPSELPGTDEDRSAPNVRSRRTPGDHDPASISTDVPRTVTIHEPEVLATRWAHLARFGIHPFLVLLDMLAVAVGAIGMEVLSRQLDLESPLRKTLAFGAVLVGLFAVGGLHRSRLSMSVLDDLPSMTGRWLVAAGLAVLGQVIWSQAIWANYIIHWQFLWGALTIGVVAVLLRGLGYAVVRRLRTHGLVAHRALVVGAGRVGRQVSGILESHPEYGLHPIGFLDADPLRHDGGSLPVLGGPGSLTALLREGVVGNVVVAFSSMKESEMVHIIRTCDRYRCELFVVPRLFELHQVDADMESAWGFPLVRLRRSTHRSPAWRVKRLVDVLASGLTLLFLAPLLAVLAIGVRLDGGPGILFRQERVGADGRHFDVLKFRSLRPVDDAESATHWNIAHDDRLSRFGRFLRATSLDELPQLYNILRGDMSLVGPRPERPHFVNQFQALYPSYHARHRVPSGLTGWAQVHGLRGDTSIAERARFDNYYIENWSLWLDLKIILRTVSAVLRRAGG
ncbi:sugar transferase [Blastococcus tunisiensis]|uniref:Undecaprenyl-phosphate glucose phosphotransferase n=1 Tax=Blastococcus tunisiensis TaxID=1798228 RepID=A0A1I2JCN1_9ACTN|nr:sugar transferase [Blastococcus sp. DSM 46838]SFF51740.1 Undecaprenyl-phosphate glucose phosphotransferase [Blastococcus sp. DSM 46838]